MKRKVEGHPKKHTGFEKMQLSNRRAAAAIKRVRTEHVRRVETGKPVHSPHKPPTQETRRRNYVGPSWAR